MTETKTAASLSCHVCDDCGTVTINFHNEDGSIFATGSLDAIDWIEMINAADDTLEEVLDRITDDDEAAPDKEHVH